ncbi:IS3 family transposase [Clostridium butyricum]|uniref:IS3 family transposase n=1 Tax=Clostridium butyricum TaxID=1492 RepID=UPI0012B865A6|nr:IS3 family transposase [Clostridium butyricum]
MAIQELNNLGYSISELCRCANIACSYYYYYYKWLNSSETFRMKENSIIKAEIINIYNEVKGIYGYRRITLNLNKRFNTNYNYKRIYRLMKSMNLKSVIRKKSKKYIKSTPQITAENKLNREFNSTAPNCKWLTDVTECKLTNEKKSYFNILIKYLEIN